MNQTKFYFHSLTLFAMSLTFVSLIFIGQDAQAASRNAILISAGMDDGGFALGADYEYRLEKSFGVGGFARFYQKDDNSEADDVNNAGVTAMGAFIRPHFQRQKWDFSVAPGLAIINVDSGTSGLGVADADGSEMGIGPVLIMDVLYQVGGNMAVGLEYIRMNDWFNSNIVSNTKEAMSFRFRFTF